MRRLLVLLVLVSTVFSLQASGPLAGERQVDISRADYAEAPQAPWEQASMALDMLDLEDQLPRQACNGVPFQDSEECSADGPAQAPGGGASDLLDTQDGSPGCVGDGVTGPRSHWLYVVPSDRTNYFSTATASGLTREQEIRDNIKFAERLMSYGTGPWREQQFRWYCSGTTPIVSQLTIGAVGTDNKITYSEVDAALEGSVYRDGDLHPLWLNLGPSDCLAFDDGTCTGNPFLVNCEGPAGSGLSAEMTFGFTGDVVFGNQAGTSTNKYVAVHESLHCLGAPDVYAKANFAPKDTHEIMTGYTPVAGSYCQRVQLDCNKDEWYSSLLAVGGSVPQWNPSANGTDGSNTATSIYLTSISTTNPALYCAGSTVGTTNKFDEVRDVFNGGSGSNIISLLDGDDWADTDGGADTICGGDGADYLHGQSDNDVLVGAGGNDELHGGTNNDTIYDGYGVDVIYGGGGTDTLIQCNDGAADSVPSNDIENYQTGDCKGRNFSTTASSS